MRWVVLCLFFLTACAQDNYTVIKGGSGSQDRIPGALKACKHEAWQAYYSDRTDASALLGGAVGGVIGGLVAGSMDEGKMKGSDLNPYVENCMKRKGYSGTSSG